MENSPKRRLRFILLGGLLAACLATAGDSKDSTQKSKAAFLSEAEVSFIRPGLVFTILSVVIDPDNTVRYQYRITDPKGVPLDRDGIVTPGTVSVSSVLAYIPKGTGIYTAYTVRTQTSPITGNSAVQAGTDSGGTHTRVSDGVYEYKFATKLPSGFDRTATHTIAAYASRNLDEFDLGSNYAANNFNWLPAGGAVTEIRKITDNQKCNTCHGNLVFHGSRTTVELCVTCHTPQTTDPDTGNTVDFTTMIHKLHQGSGLPSVQAGTPYVIIGNSQSVHDYSTVNFPADVRNCQVCHLTGQGGDQYLNNPTRRACGSCHDDVNFATGANHVAGPQVSDNQCKNCHIPKGELEFDASVSGAHTIDRFSTTLAGVKFSIISATNMAPGQRPTITFGLTDKSDKPIEPASMGRLAILLAGSTTEYADIDRFISESALTATGSNGRYTYQFTAPIPANATGSWAVAIEGYKNATLLAGTTEQRDVRDAGHNVVTYYSLSSAAAVPRRTVVAIEKCNACHYSLNLHGSSRNDTQNCVICHNPTFTDTDRPPATGPGESLNFKEFIHRIHQGPNNTRDISIYNSSGVATSFNGVRYPRATSECGACHVNGSEQLPIPANLAPVADPRGYFNPSPPVPGACISCHGTNPAAAHAESNYSPSYGESCSVCHGQGASFAVDKAHAQ